MLPTTDLEKTSLETHVDLCALRYQGLESRLTNLEAKLDEISSKIDDFKTELLWILVKAGVGMFVTIIGAAYAGLKLVGH